MAQSAQIKKVSPKHQAMIDWLIENPTLSRREMALAFGVTQPWLSTIIHSQAFQAELKRQQDKVFNVVVARPLQERLLGAAHLALDRLEEKLTVEGDVETLRRVVETLSKGAGEFQGEKNRPPTGDQFNFFNITPQDLAEARAKIGKRVTVDGELVEPASEAAGVQAGGPRLLGAHGPGPALPAQENAQPALSGGDSV